MRIEFKAVLLFTVLAVTISFALSAQSTPGNVVPSALGLMVQMPGMSGGTSSTPPADGGTPIPLSVNGAVNPELIPDDLAYRLFLRGLAFDDELTPAQAAHREAKIRRLDLTPADHDLLIAALAGVRAKIAPAFLTLNSSTATSVEMTQAQATVFDALAAAKKKLSTLSQPGQQAIDTFVRTRFKLCIQIYRDSM